MHTWGLVHQCTSPSTRPMAVSAAAPIQSGSACRCAAPAARHTPVDTRPLALAAMGGLGF